MIKSPYFSYALVFPHKENYKLFPSVQHVSSKGIKKLQHHTRTRSVLFTANGAWVKQVHDTAGTSATHNGAYAMVTMKGAFARPPTSHTPIHQWMRGKSLTYETPLTTLSLRRRYAHRTCALSKLRAVSVTTRLRPGRSIRDIGSDGTVAYHGKWCAVRHE